MEEMTIETIAQLMTEELDRRFKGYYHNVHPEDVFRFPNYDYQPCGAIPFPKEVYGGRQGCMIMLALIYADGEVDIRVI